MAKNSLKKVARHLEMLYICIPFSDDLRFVNAPGPSAGITDTTIPEIINPKKIQPVPIITQKMPFCVVSTNTPVNKNHMNTFIKNKALLKLIFI
ncbi:MAG: hypothetical protein V4722_26480 [Bacteroidota bacterium]